MRRINKIVLIIVSVGVVATTGAFLVLEKQSRPLAYGRFDSYFTGQESITYPLIFDSIRIINDPKSPAINFGPSNFDGSQIFMNVTKMSREDAYNFKSMLIERGLASEGRKSTQNGYIGEILSYDLKAHPNPNMQACSFSYRYFIPLAESDHELVLEIDASQPEWGLDGNYSHCSIFEESHYNALKAVMDYVIARIQPAF